MGLLNWLFHRQTKREFAELLRALKIAPLTERAAYLICAYLSSSTRLSPNDYAVARLAARGVDDQTIEKTAIRIFHYDPSNQTALLSLEREALETGVNARIIPFKLHKLTNLATAWPDYKPQVRDLWETLFEAAGIVPTIFEELSKRSPCPDDYEREFRLHDQYRAGLTLNAFLTNPRGLTPHFLIPDSPITKHIQCRADFSARI